MLAYSDFASRVGEDAPSAVDTSVVPPTNQYNNKMAMTTTVTTSTTTAATNTQYYQQHVTNDINNNIVATTITTTTTRTTIRHMTGRQTDDEQSLHSRILNTGRYLPTNLNQSLLHSNIIRLPPMMGRESKHGEISRAEVYASSTESP